MNSRHVISITPTSIHKLRRDLFTVQYDPRISHDWPMRVILYRAGRHAAAPRLKCLDSSFNELHALPNQTLPARNSGGQEIGGQGNRRTVPHLDGGREEQPHDTIRVPWSPAPPSPKWIPFGDLNRTVWRGNLELYRRPWLVNAMASWPWRMPYKSPIYQQASGVPHQREYIIPMLAPISVEIQVLGTLGPHSQRDSTRFPRILVGEQLARSTRLNGDRDSPVQWASS